MTRVFTCPKCRHRVELDNIGHAVIDVNGPDEWWCRRCNGTAAREDWGSSNDGIPAACYYFHGGPGKQETAGRGLSRAITRNMTFAANFASRSRLRVPMPDDPDVDGAAVYQTVAIYHRTERYSLVGRYFAPVGGNATKVALLLAGSGGTAHQHLAKVARRYCKRLNTAALLMDYRGFGSSDNRTPSEQGLFVDARAMYAFLTGDPRSGGAGWAPGDVVIHGYSLGTGVAADLAARERAAGGLVLQCPFTSAAEIAGETGGAVGEWLSRRGAEFEVKGKLPGIAKPILLLIANGDDDMKPHGDDIEAMQLPNVTVGRYDGDHFAPQNAFKDGAKPAFFKFTDINTSKVIYSAVTPPNQPVLGWQVVKTRAHGIGTANDKTSKGLGCITTISNWLGTF